MSRFVAKLLLAFLCLLVGRRMKSTLAKRPRVRGKKMASCRTALAKLSVDRKRFLTFVFVLADAQNEVKIQQEFF